MPIYSTYRWAFYIVLFPGQRLIAYNEIDIILIAQGKRFWNPILEESQRKIFFFARASIFFRKAVSSSETSLLSPSADMAWLEKKTMSAYMDSIKLSAAAPVKILLWLLKSPPVQYSFISGDATYFTPFFYITVHTVRICFPTGEQVYHAKCCFYCNSFSACTPRYAAMVHSISLSGTRLLVS